MKNHAKMTDLFALLVFVIFAVCLLAVLLGGARSYEAVVQRGGESFEARTAAQYVSTRVRQAGGVAVADFSGCDALVIPETVGEETYLTRVYCYDGYLRELYCPENAALQPRDGEKLIPMEQMQLSVDGRILRVQLDAQVLLLHLEGKEAAP